MLAGLLMSMPCIACSIAEGSRPIPRAYSATAPRTVGPSQLTWVNSRW